MSVIRPDLPRPDLLSDLAVVTRRFVASLPEDCDEEHFDEGLRRFQDALEACDRVQ